MRGRNTCLSTNTPISSASPVPCRRCLFLTPALQPQWSEMWHLFPGAVHTSLISRMQGTGRAGAEEGRDNVGKLLVGSSWSLTPSPAAFQFFVLVSLVFLTQLVGAVLFLVHWKQVLALSPVSPASLCHTMAMAQSPPGNWGWDGDILPLTSISSTTTQTSKQVGGVHWLPSSPQKELVLSRVGEEQSQPWHQSHRSSPSASCPNCGGTMVGTRVPRSSPQPGTPSWSR